MVLITAHVDFPPKTTGFCWGISTSSAPMTRCLSSSGDALWQPKNQSNVRWWPMVVWVTVRRPCTKRNVIFLEIITKVTHQNRNLVSKPTRKFIQIAISHDHQNNTPALRIQFLSGPDRCDINQPGKETGCLRLDGIQFPWPKWNSQELEVAKSLVHSGSTCLFIICFSWIGNQALSKFIENWNPTVNISIHIVDRNNPAPPGMV